MVKINDETIQTFEKALRNGDGNLVSSLTKDLLANGVLPMVLVQQVLVPSLSNIGRDFQDFKVFLPELMLAGDAATYATALIEDAALENDLITEHTGTIVIGTVEGDVHDIGKNIVIVMLKAHGFKIIDLGRSVKASTFLDAAIREQADLVGVSALMTTTLPAQKRTISLFDETGEHDNFKLVIGGGAANSDWSDEIGADGYASDAVAAIEICRSLMKG